MNVNLYEEFQKMSYSELKELFKKSSSKDEQDFYMALANMKLQIEQENFLKRGRI